MLKQRVITALVLLPLVVMAVLWLPRPYLSLLLGLVVLLGAHEWARLCGLQTPPARVGFVGLVAMLLAGGYFLLSDSLRDQLLQLTALWWFGLTLALFARRNPLQVHSQVRWWRLLAGALLLPAAWLALLALHALDPRGPLLLFVMILIWVVDSGAYFAGKAFGRRKLAPLLSPGKTWEGVAGAMLGALVVAWVLDALALVPALSLPAWALLCPAVAFVSITGDLYESLLKREAGVKDSGRLLPGHGGVLDRVDSLIAAAPVFHAALLLLGGAA